MRISPEDARALLMALVQLHEPLQRGDAVGSIQVARCLGDAIVGDASAKRPQPRQEIPASCPTFGIAEFILPVAKLGHVGRELINSLRWAGEPGLLVHGFVPE